MTAPRIHRNRTLRLPVGASVMFLFGALTLAAATTAHAQAGEEATRGPASGDEAARRRSEAPGAVAATAEWTPPSVVATVEPDTATVGDRLHLTLTVDSPEGAGLVFPSVVEEVAPLEVLDVRSSGPQTSDGRVRETREYVLAAFETGDLGIPPMVFLYRTAEGDTAVAMTDSLHVTIVSVLPEVREDQEVGPRDIKPPAELPRRVWPFILAAVIAAVLAAGLWFARRWWKGRERAEAEEPEPEPVVPRRAAHVVALERLEELAREDYIGRREMHPFYVRLSEIVRLYLRDRFGVDAIDMTTTEIGPAMRDARIDENDVVWMTRYLLHADLAKFARHVPDQERAGRDLNGAREFVERTRFMDGVAGSGETAGESLPEEAVGAPVADQHADSNGDSDRQQNGPMRRHEHRDTDEEEGRP